MQTIEKTINCYEAGSVTRYHTHPRLNRFTQSDAAHSWGVVALITQLHPDPSKELLLAAILHDTGERFAGDLPAPVKRANPELAATHAELESRLRADTIYGGDYDISEDDNKWLKMCDMLECVMFASLTLPEILTTPPWKSLMTGIWRLSLKLDAKPTVDIQHLMEVAHRRQGFAELGGSFDYTKYANETTS